MAAHEAEIVSSPSFIPLENSKLTTKQNLFVHYYLETKNGVKSAKLAGYSGDTNTLNQTARANLQNPTIRNSIESYYKARLLSPDGVLAELSDIASAPWKDFVEVKLDPATGQVVDVKMRLADKIKANELLGKFYQHWDAKIQIEDVTERDPIEAYLFAVNSSRKLTGLPEMTRSEAEEGMKLASERAKLKTVNS